MSLRARLLLAALYVLSVVVVGLEVPLALAIERSERREFESGILANATLLAARINDDLPAAGTDPRRPPQPPQVLTRIVLATARALPEVRFVVTDRLGRAVADSAREARVGEEFATSQRPEFGAVLAERGGTIFAATRYSDTLGEDLFIVAVPVVHDRDAIGVVRATVPLGSLNARVRRAWVGLAIVGAIAIAAGLVATWFLGRSLARPVERLERAAVRLGGGDLEARAQAAGPREVATLARSFNQMAEALAANMVAQRDFLANASHQLKTPLTGLRLRLEAIEQEGGFAATQATKAQAEVDRLASLVQDLLDLARASSVESTGTALDVVERARRAVDRWTPPAAEGGKRVRIDATAGATVWADPGDLDHVLDNLIENAIRYTPEGTTITVGAGSVDGRSFLSVADDGPGIPSEERQRIFDRFYRGTTGKRAGPGSGLGLAIAGELVRRWGGEIRLEDGPGTRVVATFPAGRGRPSVAETAGFTVS